MRRPIYFLATIITIIICVRWLPFGLWLFLPAFLVFPHMIRERRLKKHFEAELRRLVSHDWR